MATLTDIGNAVSPGPAPRAPSLPAVTPAGREPAVWRVLAPSAVAALIALLGAVFFAVYLLVTPAWTSIVTDRAEPASAASAAPAQVPVRPRSSVGTCGIEALARNHGVCA